jgi:hypothetical protein
MGPPVEQVFKAAVKERKELEDEDTETMYLISKHVL